MRCRARVGSRNEAVRVRGIEGGDELRITLLALALLSLGMAQGCGDLSNLAASDEQPYRIALMVSDLEGAALGGASVWIDNVLMGEKTAAGFTPLDGGFPSEWHGWTTNFISPTLHTLVDPDVGVARIEVIVSKPGYRVSRVGFDVWETGETFFLRAAVPLEPAG